MEQHKQAQPGSLAETAGKHQQPVGCCRQQQAGAEQAQKKMPPSSAAPAASEGGGPAPKPSTKASEGGDKLATELEQIQDKRKRDRRPGFFSQRRSKIARYHAEVVRLKELGASLEDIRLWLQRRRVKVQRSTIHRYLKREGVC